MKLGEALSVRARQAAKLNDLRGRIKANAVKQEGQDAPEDAGKLLEEFCTLSAEHAALVTRINKTNVLTLVDRFAGDQPVENTLLDLLAAREDLNRQRGTIELAANASSSRDAFRYMRSELATVATLDVAALRVRSDGLTERVAALDAKIQAVNWATDLI